MAFAPAAAGSFKKLPTSIYPTHGRPRPPAYLPSDATMAGGA